MYRNGGFNMNTNELSYKLFLQRESGEFHSPYNAEVEFYNKVCQGRYRELKSESITLLRPGQGKLSDNPVRNAKYHFIVLVAMITRFCYEAGMEYEDAYTLSDLYIQKVDLCTTSEEVFKLNRDMVLDFAKRMENKKKEKIYSRHIVKATEYIYDHLNEKLSIDEISTSVGVNGTYLCKMFKKEMNITIGGYIENLRIEAAQNMLRFSDYSSTDIANYLSFSSHSYFIKVFKKHTGDTPQRYRDKHLNKRWSKDIASMEEDDD